ncbi:hypothetical protein QJQ45_003362 [Haematococcus lacustris]|nr:hypothetical protein QJQ45_003362 [Haematococcus lacustris]
MRSMPACLTIVDPVAGKLLWQNAASMAAFGGATVSQGSADSSPMDFLDMLFNSRKEELQQVHDQVAVGQCFRARLEVVHWQLRQWMGLEAKQRCFHEVHITAVRAPHVLGNVYVVAQAS